MTIDERLERLTERHEALALTIELSQQHWEERWAKIAAALDQDAQAIRSLTGIAQATLESIRRLEHTAEIHEHRLSHLEGQ